jgi:hypothetical protein
MTLSAWLRGKPNRAGLGWAGGRTSLGVVVGDDDGRGAPGLRPLQRVDGVDEETLLIERVGVAGVAVLVLGGFEK